MNSNFQADNSTRDVFIAYSHGNNHENVSDIKHVCNELKKEGYTVFFDEDNYGDAQLVGQGQNIDILKRAQCVLVFLDPSIENIDKSKGLYDELKALKERIEKDNFSTYRFYRYKGFCRGKHIQSSELEWIKKTQDIGYYRTGKELSSSLNSIVRDVDQMLHGFNFYSYHKWRRIARTTVVTVLALLFLLVLAVITLRKTNSELDTYDTPLVVFAGGSTAKELIDKTAPGVIDNFPHSTYIHMGSRSAWGLLFEEQLGSDKSDYLPIVLSAGEVTTEALETLYGFNDSVNYRIIQLHLDDIPLIVQLHPAQWFSGYDTVDTITVEKLQNLLDTSKATILTTSEQSGTIKAYRTKIKWEESKSKIFQPDNISQYKHSIMLVNRMHRVKNNEFIKDLIVKDSAICNIPVYIYVTAKKDKDICVINKRAKMFLDSICVNGQLCIIPDTITSKNAKDFLEPIIKFPQQR